MSSRRTQASVFFIHTPYPLQLSLCIYSHFNIYPRLLDVLISSSTFTQRLSNRSSFRFHQKKAIINMQLTRVVILACSTLALAKPYHYSKHGGEHRSYKAGCASASAGVASGIAASNYSLAAHPYSMEPTATAALSSAGGASIESSSPSQAGAIASSSIAASAPVVSSTSALSSVMSTSTLAASSTASAAPVGGGTTYTATFTQCV